MVSGSGLLSVFVPYGPVLLSPLSLCRPVADCILGRVGERGGRGVRERERGKVRGVVEGWRRAKGVWMEEG